MGLGDQLLATGLARGAHARGKRIAFGDKQKIIWDKNSGPIFYNNKNIAAPGSERDADIEWIGFYRGNRIYNKQGSGRWIWNYDFRPTPGELFFTEDELRYAQSIKPNYVIIEPNLPWHKSVAPNKDWGFRNYQELADRLLRTGYNVAQFSFGRYRLSRVKTIPSPSFRHAIAAMTRAKLAILPEGGLHHGAAAVDLPAVVLFGGFIPPQVTGYDLHTNLTGGAEACGSLGPCSHCRKAMEKISVDEVYEAATSRLKGMAA